MPDFMPSASLNREAALEAFRRRAQMSPPSLAGFPPGVGNLSPRATEPSAVMAERKTGAPQAPQMASRGGINQLRQSTVGEAELIIKALIQRLRSLTPKAPTAAPAAPTGQYG